jgi:HK97 family phage portal protein
MTRLFDRIRTGGADRSLLPEPELVAFMSQTWGGTKSEQILRTYRDYSALGYSSNSVVFSCVLARLQMIAQAEFKFQDLATGKLYDDPELEILRNPWPGGTTGDLLARAEQHNSISGNFFVRRELDTLVWMRPDWVEIVSSQGLNGRHDVLGILYSEGGLGESDGTFYNVEDIAHWAPIPDPLGRHRGMSWLTPVLREVNADVAMTRHRQVFFDNAATPNLMLKYQQKLNNETLMSIKERWQARYGGPAGAGGTVVLDEGADLSIVGSSFKDMDYSAVQSAGEARIASAAGVPAIVAGLSRGLDAATYSNYEQALKAFGNGTMAFLWQSICSALTPLVNVPEGSRLWYDVSGIPALRDGENERALTMQILAQTASTLLTAGYESSSIVDALTAGDMTLLKHTGLVSVQLYKAAAKQDAAQEIDKIPVTQVKAFSPPTLPGA